MKARDDILDYIRRNRVSTTEVADALGKSGVLPSLVPLTTDHFRAGPVRCVFTANESNHAVHDQIRDVQEGEIVIIFAENCEGRAILGDLVSKYILMYRRAEALVVNGLVRDASRLRRERYPIWAYGASPLGCYNVPAAPFSPERERAIRQAHEGGIAICDDGGVVVIPPDRLDAEMLQRLENIELQEDIWYYCLNTLKWDTKRIVCDKEYLKDPGVVPAPLAAKLHQLERPLDGRR